MRRILPIALLALTLPLASCSWFDWMNPWSGDSSAPASSSAATDATFAGCPQVASIRDLSLYQNPAVATDDQLVVNVRMGNVKSTCSSVSDGFKVDASFDVAALRGAASQAKNLSIPFFVSVVNAKDEILQRDTYEIPLTFDGDTKQMRVNTPFSINVPSSDGNTNRVLIGFQLSQDQLNANASFFGSK